MCLVRRWRDSTALTPPIRWTRSFSSCFYQCEFSVMLLGSFICGLVAYADGCFNWCVQVPSRLSLSESFLCISDDQ
jgi:hypothetical protein